MATALRDLPRFLVLAGVSTVRLEMRLESSACEIDVELQNPRPGRSFVLLIGHKDGPYVQRVRLSGRARIHFDPQAPGEYLLLLANPNREPLVLRLKARDLLPSKRGAKRPPPKVTVRSRPSKKRGRAGAKPRRKRTPSADTPESPKP